MQNLVYYYHLYPCIQHVLFTCIQSEKQLAFVTCSYALLAIGVWGVEPPHFGEGEIFLAEANSLEMCCLCGHWKNVSGSWMQAYKVTLRWLDCMHRLYHPSNTVRVWIQWLPVGWRCRHWFDEVRPLGKGSQGRWGTLCAEALHRSFQCRFVYIIISVLTVWDGSESSVAWFLHCMGTGLSLLENINVLCVNVCVGSAWTLHVNTFCTYICRWTAGSLCWLVCIWRQQDGVEWTTHN